MSSTLKLYGVLALFFGVVFGAVFIKQYVPTDSGGGTGDPGETAFPAQPLQFAYREVRFDPASDLLLERAFPGFFEVADKENLVSFWFKNPNPTPVEMRVLGRSCSTCSAARVGVVPPKALGDAAKWAGPGAVAALAGVPDLLGPLSAVGAVEPAIKWHEFDFDRMDASGFEVPAAPSADVPTVGVFQVAIKVKGTGPVTRTVGVGVKPAGAPTGQSLSLSVHLVGMAPFELLPPEIDLGTLREGAEPVTREVVYWSATRANGDGRDQLPPPAAAVAGQDPFVQVGTPVPLSAADRDALATRLAGTGENARPVAVRGGYRLPLTVRRTLPDGTEPDIGPFERSVGVVGPAAADSRRVVLRGTVTGLVAVAGTENNLVKLGKNGDFNASADTVTTVTLVSDRTGLELETVPDESTARGVQVELSAPETRDGRRYWTMKLTVPARALVGPLPANAAVVLRRKGAKPQKVRIPVQGTGFIRG